MLHVFVIQCENDFGDDWVELFKAHSPTEAEDTAMSIYEEGTGVICIGMLGENCDSCDSKLCTNRRK